MVDAAIKKADVLIEALPYIKNFQGKIFVIKYGGSILGEERVRKGILEDIAFLRFAGICPVLIHGGGPYISERLKNENTPVKFIDGMRVTTKTTLKVAEEELSKLNDLISEEIAAHGVKVTPFKGDLLEVVKKSDKDLGFVGTVVGFDQKALIKSVNGSIPVIVPLGKSKDGQLYNINADDVACYIAAQLKAKKLVLLTKVLGVMKNVDDPQSLISTIDKKTADELISNEVIDSGMVPKVRAAIESVQTGVGKAHIVDAKMPHALLLEIFTDKGIGTEIIA
ncbi:MAG: acetylglutamate kinase [Candidatus Omnitrophica bacterium]|nr:acetylglutamate kinase [Candidatus Omnitrophota bacterium]